MTGPDAGIIFKYFPDLSETQRQQIMALYDLYISWNQKINVISRKDADNLYLHHVLHSLSIARFVRFLPGSHILDLGTGGGFPGVPLGILFPETNFTLIDGTGKKITVVNEVASALGLRNVNGVHVRAEDWSGSVDFVVSRAVAPLEQLMLWCNDLISETQKHPVPNGLICLKGGDLHDEITVVKRRTYVEKTPLSTWFEEPFFQEKYLIYAQAY